MSKIQNMQQSLAIIRKELSSYYEPEEIQGFIRMIFYHLKSYSLTDMVINQQEQLSETEKKKIFSIVAELKAHRPIQYILGNVEFCDLHFKVNENVLIPRPETEELVQWIIDDFKLHPNVTVFDACTGSGCIAIGLAHWLNSPKVSACDISAEALELAQINAKENRVSVDFHLADMLHAQSFDPASKFDIMVSNPPYVLHSEKAAMNENVLKHEPHLALFVEDDEALIFYDAIADFSLKHLKLGGKLYFEINEAYALETAEMLKNKGFVNTEIRQDVFGKNRMIKTELKN
ncbi:MAG: peptide chain release factor N(5)-glutamine methyltransferase [Mangrovibacterium sp.]